MTAVVNVAFLLGYMDKSSFFRLVIMFYWFPLPYKSSKFKNELILKIEFKPKILPVDICFGLMLSCIHN